MTFDPSAFINSTIDSPLDTEFFQLPEGDYEATVDNFSQEEGKETFKPLSKNDEPILSKATGQQLVTFNPSFVITNDKRLAGRDQYTVRGQGFIDFDDAGRIDTSRGRNVLMGMLRNACGINAPGIPLDQAVGKRVMIHVYHEADKTNPRRKYARVDRIAPLR